MTHTGSCPVGRARIGRPTFLGLAAAAAWLVGLVVGVSALITGHPVVAAVSVVLALGAPWLGLAWNLHARLRADDVRLRFPNSGLPLTAA